MHRTVDHVGSTVLDDCNRYVAVATHCAAALVTPCPGYGHDLRLVVPLKICQELDLPGTVVPWRENSEEITGCRDRLRQDRSCQLGRWAPRRRHRSRQRGHWRNLQPNRLLDHR